MVRTGLTRWDPSKEVEELQNRLSGLFGRAPVRRKNGEQESITVAEWAPLLDITESGMTRLPRVVETARSLINKRSHQEVNPDEEVAVGAAIQAGVLKAAATLSKCSSASARRVCGTSSSRPSNTHGHHFH